MVQVLSRSEPKARTSHKCQMCFRVIDPGETYERQFNVFDGRAYTWKTCTHCQALMRLASIEYEADEGYSDETIDEWEPGDVWELRLKALWRKKWRRKDGSLYPVPTS